MCSRRWEMPVKLSGSLKYPVFTQVLMATTGAEWRSSINTIIPLSNKARVTSELFILLHPDESQFIKNNRIDNLANFKLISTFAPPTSQVCLIKQFL